MFLNIPYSTWVPAGNEAWISACPHPPPANRHHKLIWASSRAWPCSFLWSVVSVSPAKKQEHCVLGKSTENFIFWLRGRRGPSVHSVSLKGLEMCWCCTDARGMQRQHPTDLVNKWLWSSSVLNNGRNLNLGYCWHGSCLLLFNKACKINTEPPHETLP